MEQLKEVLSNQMLEKVSAKSSTIVDLSYLPILGSFLLGLLLKDKIGFLGQDRIDDDDQFTDDDDWTNPDMYNSVYDEMPNDIERNADYHSGYNRNYHNPYSFTEAPQETYLTTVTPRLQRSFIPLRDSEWDSYVDASKINNKIYHNDYQNAFGDQWQENPSNGNYDYTISREDYENMMLNNQYPYVQHAREQPRTYQNMLVSRLQNRPEYSQVRRSSNRMFPRNEQRSFNIQEAPQDGTWAGSSDWVANWVEKK
eukprot:TRINITY_DN32885_c0_g1_i1.p1 TRINITY_DN32885_c0_g1~~TRINITY_DN32885_c0_g1_i1.p1  ORF type:complete len:255 (+),score=55.05 TRINITY_DN32885_c0_g1_i1:57-821(+)